MTEANKQSVDGADCGAETRVSEWCLYLLRRGDGGLYTGITTDVPRRFAQHRSGKGARALRGKALVGIGYSQILGSRSLASQVEYAVKRLAKAEKERLVLNAPTRSQLLELLGIQTDECIEEVQS